MISIDRFFTHPISVQRRSGVGAEGSTYAPADTTIKARIRIQNRVVKTADGKEVTALATLAVPADVPRIPPGSRIDLPQRFSARTVKVIAEGVHDAGTGRHPAFYQLFVE